MFMRSGAAWGQQAKLVGTEAIGSQPQQGGSVAVSGDGNTAIVGGRADDDVGAAWVYTRSGGVWSQQAKLVGTGAIGMLSPQQGGSVALSGDGNTAIVGAPIDNNQIGAAWVFTRSGEAWSQQQKLVGTGVLSPPPGAGQGSSVALSADANTVLVGGPEDNNGIGAAWVYTQPVFAGTPGYSNCYGKSTSALTQQYGGLGNAAAALGYPSAKALQTAIVGFCEG